MFALRQELCLRRGVSRFTKSFGGYSSIGVKSNLITSKSPRVVIFSSGITASDLIMVTDAWRTGVHAAGGTMHRIVFLTLSFKSLLLSIEKQKRTSENACPLYPSEKQGFVLAFCKAIRVKYFYALQKPSVYAQRFVASNNASHSCDKSHNRWLCPLRSISANASACFSLRLRSATKNDAPCRFLNALVQIPVVKYRKTKTDK